MPNEKRTETTWTSPGKRFPRLNQNLETDVLVVGAGMAGVLAAYTLSRAGRRVILVEKERLGTGASELTTAFLTAYIDTEYREMQKIFGIAKTRQVWQSHTEAINYIEHIVREEKIECEFMRTENIVFANTTKEYRTLRDEAAALKRAGARVKLSQAPHPDIENVGYLSIANQAKFHPLKFLQRVAQAALAQGTLIYEQSEIKSLKKSKDGYRAEVNGKEVWAQNVIVATYLPFNAQPKLKFKKGKYISYVLELRVPSGAIAEGIYEDTENPYHYFRVDKLGRGGRYDRIIAGGEDHRHEIKINPKKSFVALERHLKKIWPNLQYKVIRRWRGPIIEPGDGLAFIGEVKEGQYVATGFSGNGMTYSAISALLLTDMITDKNRSRAKSWGKLYKPGRIPTPKQLMYKARDYIGEFIGGAGKNMLESRHVERISLEEDDAKPAR